MKRFWFFLFLSSAMECCCQVKLYGEAQGTTYSLQYFDSLNRDFQNEIDSLLYFFDQGVSTYQNSSEISQINKNLINEVNDPYFLHCFTTAKTLWYQTHGAFDPTVYPLVNAWGFGPESFGRNLPSKQTIDSLLAFVGFEKINLNHNVILKTDARVALDFNAFAQGYSVDIVSQFLEQKGIVNYIVEIGGEVFAKGPNWKIGIEAPTYNKYKLNAIQIILSLNNKGVATSGNYRKYVEYDGVKYAHHIDPKTGYPTKNRLLSATVIADQTIIADATATGLLVLGLRKAKNYLKHHPEIDAMLIYSKKSGKLKRYYSRNWEPKIKESQFLY